MIYDKEKISVSNPNLYLDLDPVRKRCSSIRILKLKRFLKSKQFCVSLYLLQVSVLLDPSFPSLKIWAVTCISLLEILFGKGL